MAARRKAGWPLGVVLVSACRSPEGMRVALASRDTQPEPTVDAAAFVRGAADGWCMALCQRSTGMAPCQARSWEQVSTS